MSNLTASEKYFPAFDYLRFVLAVTVVVHHCYQDLWGKTGDIAVRIFFALSGWLIGAIILRAKRKDLPHFYFNRSTRIWIPYAGAIALLFSLSAMREVPTPRQLEFLVYCVTFAWNWFTTLPDPVSALSKLPFGWGGAPFWSICVEEQFYLLVPILIIFIPKIGRSITAWTILSSVLVAAQNEFASIALGVLAAVTNQRFGNWHLTRLATAALMGICLLCGMLMLPAYKFASPFFAVGVVLLLARQGPQTSFGKFLGGASYPIYLNHGIGSFIAISLAKRFFPDHETMIALGSFVLGISIGVVMYVLIDRQVMKRRRAYFTMARGKIAALTGYSLVAIGLTFGVLRWYVIPFIN